MTEIGQLDTDPPGSRYESQANWYTNNSPRTMTYAGIGSRPKPGKPIPPQVIAFAKALAASLEQQGYTLRSGAAPGLDEAFESGVEGSAKEIYLPWPKFQNHPSPLFLGAEHDRMWRPLWELAKKHHPAWHNVTPKAALLLMRNGFQVLGWDLDKPVDFCLCWTHDGQDSGGTGQAIRICRARMIPVFNLANVSDLHWLSVVHPWAKPLIEQFAACIPRQGR